MLVILFIIIIIIIMSWKIIFNIFEIEINFFHIIRFFTVSTQTETQGNKLFDNYDEDDEVNNADCSYGLGIL